MDGKSVGIYLASRKLILAAPPLPAGMVSVNDLQAHIETTKGIRIELRMAREPMNQDKSRGILRRHDLEATIDFAQMNPCWTRFVILKELMHIWSDLSPSHSKDTANLLSDLNMGTDFEPVAHESEDVAEDLAIAYALPLTTRPADLSGTTASDVAHKYKIPTLMVERFYAVLAPQQNEIHQLIEQALRL